MAKRCALARVQQSFYRWPGIALPVSLAVTANAASVGEVVEALFSSPPRGQDALDLANRSPPWLPTSRPLRSVAESGRVIDDTSAILNDAFFRQVALQRTARW